MNKIKLNVLGISYSQTQTGAYALVLNEENGEHRIPIIVGAYEAQAIAIQLEGLNPPRPLTHDLFLNFARSFKIEITEVIIYKLEEGIFYSRLICNDGTNSITIDSRTSDAIALALRFKCPIYTTEEIIEKAGIILEAEKEKEKEKDKEKEKEKTAVKEEPTKESKASQTTKDVEEIKIMTVEELNVALEEAIKNEDYEKASLLRDEIKRKSKKKS
jgi:uncharacterized protein